MSKKEITRKEKIKDIRRALNDDRVMNEMTDEELDEIVDVIRKPIVRLINAACSAFKRITEAMPWLKY